ncbi:hypothetical protein EVAR_53045_1 [Eumeta japonica]|uniref:Secreted protein n=1 Tax=Eumeta variegata TaxID=151549 RepID=A0A4C1YWZ3_EUMVA|nr:hypothetical protein EVAR_53045_1 [Eumeta japonica]
MLSAFRRARRFPRCAFLSLLDFLVFDLDITTEAIAPQCSPSTSSELDGPETRSHTSIGLQFGVQKHNGGGPGERDQETRSGRSARLAAETLCHVEINGDIVVWVVAVDGVIAINEAPERARSRRDPVVDPLTERLLSLWTGQNII